jgi:hypothetical protein
MRTALVKLRLIPARLNLTARIPAAVWSKLVVAALLTSCACSSQGQKPGAAVSETQAAPRITMFYASPAQPSQGEKTLLCYGVENASEVHLDPPVDRLWSTVSRCLEVPTRAATYTLTAQRGSDRVSQSITITLLPPKVRLLEVSINKLAFAPGEQATVCYKAKNASRVTVKPGSWIEPHRPDLGCVWDRPQHSTTYVVTATGVHGDTDSERVTASVKSGK